jgi:hypothetical protein
LFFIFAWAKGNNVMPSIAELLSAARRRSFVGREKEIELFERFLDPDQTNCVLLYIYGPGGQGKTTLAKYLMDVCLEKKVNHILVDARDIEPRPPAFYEALRQAMGKTMLPDAQSNLFEQLEAIPGRVVLMIDTYEKMNPLDDWMRVEFLPQLPSKVLVVMLGRNAPTLNWMTDSGWKALMRVLPLRDFSAAESEEYLKRRNIPTDKIRQITDFTHGHPLALSVVADIYEQFPDKNFSPDESPDLIRTLLQLFVRQVPSPMHRAALEVCALVNILTESLLAEVMSVEDAGELFSWMCGLSFISIGREGIYPHDVTREALCADLRWRHPDWNATLHQRARHYYHRKLKETTGEQQRRVLFDLLYLHRLNPVVKPFFDWQESGSFWVDAAQSSDLPVLRDMVLGMEGPENLAAFDYWSKHPAAQIWVWRDGARAANAFVLKINTHELTTEQAAPDPVMHQLLDYKRRNLPLRSGEQGVAFRFWMALETYQGVSTLQSSIFLAMVQYYFTPGLAISFLPVVFPDFWRAGFGYGDLHPVPELDYNLNGNPYGWYMHDWRVRPPMAWLELLGKRETDPNADFEADAPKALVAVLDEVAFSEALGEALRQFHNNNNLTSNALLHSKLICRDINEDAGDAQRINILKEKIQTALKDMEISPIDGKYHRILYRTYINPVGSQEKTADFLNMSFSTYRRYLQAGTQRLIEILWLEEIS